jgi:hypothetical protein
MGLLFEPTTSKGITSKLVPYQLNKTGVKVGFGIGAAAAIGKEMHTNHNRMKMGPITYEGGAARMTHNVTSGAIEAIKDTTTDPEVRADMIKHIMRSDDGGILSNIDEMGVDPEFVSAFYGMG